MMHEAQFIELARAFLRERLGGQADAVDGDTELVDSGLLDSLLVLEFFFFLEEISGEAIEPDADSITEISTLRRAYRLITAA